jgi:tetratricopeptide (TPR) repeat protein
MKRRVVVSRLFLAAASLLQTAGFSALCAAPPPADAGWQVLLVAHDLEGNLLPGICFRHLRSVSKPTTERGGSTVLDLPPGHRLGEQIEIEQAACSQEQTAREWLLLTRHINIPGPADAADMVLLRSTTFRQIAAKARDAALATTEGAGPPAAEGRMRALTAEAAIYGLSLEQAQAALRSFAETQDPVDRGIAAYFEGNFRQAVKLLSGVGGEHELAENLRYLGAAQYEDGNYRAAADSFRKALALRGQEPALLGWLGNSLDQLAEWGEAETLLRRALAIDENKFGPEHPDVARDLNNLAILLQATSRLGEAEPLLRRALTIDEKSFGKDDPVAARDLDNLGQLLQETNHLEEAEQLLRQALAIDEKKYGPDNPIVAVRLNDLAAVLHATSRLTEAEGLLRRALAIDEKKYGPDNPDVARDLSALALLLKPTNRQEEAEPLLRRALAIDEKSFGSDHPSVATDLNNLALLLKATGRLEDAEPLMRRALAIDEKSHGLDHPDVARDLNNLGRLLQATKRLGDAELLERQALAIGEKVYGPEHPVVATYLCNLAQLLQATSRPREAEPLLRRALTIDEKSFGPDDLDVARDLYYLARLLEATKQLGEAEPLIRRAVRILFDFQRKNGHEHQSQSEIVDNYRQLLGQMGKSPAEVEAALTACAQAQP